MPTLPVCRRGRRRHVIMTACRQTVNIRYRGPPTTRRSGAFLDVRVTRRRRAFGAHRRRLADDRTTGQGDQDGQDDGSDLERLPIPDRTHVLAAACIMGAYQASDRGGDRPGPAIPRNPCQDNVYYLYNGAGSAVSRPRPCRRRRRRTRRSSDQEFGRPPPEGGRGVRVPICIDN